MTTVSFFKRDDKILGFEFDGHANYAHEDGIVCASLSALSISTVNSLEEIAGLNENEEYFVEIYEDDDKDEVKLSFKYRTDDPEKDYISQILLKSLLLSVKNIYKEHSDRVALYVKEVKKC